MLESQKRIRVTNKFKIMRQAIYIVLISSILLFLLACKKDTKQEPIKNYPEKKIYVSNEMRQLGIYKPGTYWIVKDTVTNVIDSICVTLNQFDYGSKLEKDTNVMPEKVISLCAGQTYTFSIEVSSGLYFPNETIESSNIVFVYFWQLSSGPMININNAPFAYHTGSITSSFYNDSVNVENKWYKNIHSGKFMHQIGHDPIAYSNGYCHWQKNGGFVTLSCNTPTRNICLKVLRRNIVQ